MRLPVKDGIIDYAFMERFIAELEAERVKELEAEHVRELEAYLEATGLKDYILTPAERNVLAGGANVHSKSLICGICSGDPRAVSA